MNSSENDYWESITEYKKHVKKEMCELVMNLEEVIDTKGTFEYHIYFNHFKNFVPGKKFFLKKILQKQSLTSF